MDNTSKSFESLKNILQNSRNPEQLNHHPWVHGLFVHEALTDDPSLLKATPGQQLLSALSGLFRQMQPVTPPRQGIRLDSRWGEFGILAALYFAPINHGIPYPSSQRDAWNQIDQAILYLIFGKPAKALKSEDIEKFKLVGDELEFGSASTLSDWHKKGIQRFSELILNRERYLSRHSTRPSIILQTEGQGYYTKNKQVRGSTKQTRQLISTWKLTFWLAIIFVMLIGIGTGGAEAWKIIRRAQQVQEQVVQLQTLAEAPLDLKQIEMAGSSLRSMQSNLKILAQETKPLLLLGPALSWFPVYGNDLKLAPELSALVEHMTNAIVQAYNAVQPLLVELQSQNSNLTPVKITNLIALSQPELLKAREELDQAIAIRKTIQVENLSPRLKHVLGEEVDPLLIFMDDSLSVFTALPVAMGASSEGPKTYLILVQNEDELRPTGGFITSVGKLVLHNGQIISLSFEQVDEQEDWSKPYPAAPWQLQEYMNSRVLVLRDSNWFSDFPTSALWAENLYAYTHAHSVDGVIAFDQQFLVMLLRQLGPLDLDSASYPITHENVIQYMRTAKTPPSGESVPSGWDRKSFISDIANAISRKINSGITDWHELIEVVTQALTERHLLLQFDDSRLETFLIKHDWDNAIKPSHGDFLMITDTNIGFNKTNALVDTNITYEVDLSNLSNLKTDLIITHTNHADSNVPCIQWGYEQHEEINGYPMNRCYWNYLRIYKQGGISLLEASPHTIPGNWMLLRQEIPARVDKLDEEIPGVQGFGTLLVVPGGQSVQTKFKFSLPSSVLTTTKVAGQVVYQLKIQKQPGTIANPLIIHIQLPTEAKLISISMGSVQQNNNLLIETNLRTDVLIKVVFNFP